MIHQQNSETRDLLDFLNHRPIHPEPKPLESFCCYFVRSANVSGFTKMSQWAQMLGLGKFYWEQLSDFPRTHYGVMAKLLNLSEQQLLGMTFHYLGEKLNCTRRSQLFKVTLGLLAHTLRYCPFCLTEADYYQLPWRLSMIKGCVEHGCYLQDSCPHCKQTLPVISSTTIGRCPFCDGKLSEGQGVPLSASDLIVNRVRTADLVYLLQPQDHLYQLTIREKFIKIRQALGIKRDDLARDFQARRGDLRLFERDDERTTTLERCFALADYFGMSLRQVLAYGEYDFKLSAVESSEISGVCRIRKKEIQTSAEAYERDLLSRVKGIADALVDGHQSVQLTASELLNVGYREISLYSSVKNYLETLELEREQRYGEKRLKEIQVAIDLLKSKGELPTGPRLKEIVGYDVHRFRHFPEIDEIVSQTVKEAAEHIIIWNQDHTECRYEDWPTIRTRVRTILSEAESRGQYLFKKELTQMIGANRNTLQYDPEIGALLDAHEAKRLEAWEKRELEDCDRAWQYLRETQQPINVQDLGKLMGVKHEYMRRHPKLWKKVMAYVEQYKHEQEQLLVSRVEQSVEKMRMERVKISLTLISDEVGMAPDNLKRHPLVLTYLNALPEFPVPLKAPLPPKPRNKKPSSELVLS